MLYLNEAALHSNDPAGVPGEEEIKDFLVELEAATLDERGGFVVELVESLGAAAEAVELPKTPQEEKQQGSCLTN